MLRSLLWLREHLLYTVHTSAWHHSHQAVLKGRRNRHVRTRHSDVQISFPVFRLRWFRAQKLRWSHNLVCDHQTGPAADICEYSTCVSTAEHETVRFLVVEISRLCVEVTSNVTPDMLQYVQQVNAVIDSYLHKHTDTSGTSPPPPPPVHSPQNSVHIVSDTTIQKWRRRLST